MMAWMMAWMMATMVTWMTRWLKSVDVFRGPGTGLVVARGEDASLARGSGLVAVLAEVVVDASLARGIGRAAAT